MPTSKPVPLPDIDTAPFWAAANQGRLSLPRCDACATIVFPPRPRCPHCLSDALRWAELAGTGVVYSFCVMHMALVPGFDPPYAVALVELTDQPGLRLTAGIVDCPVSAVRIGMEVEVVFERRSPQLALPVFRPRRPHA